MLEVLRREVPLLFAVELKDMLFIVEFMVWSSVILGSADMLKLRTAVVMLPLIEGNTSWGTG